MKYTNNPNSFRRYIMVLIILDDKVACRCITLSLMHDIITCDALTSTRIRCADQSQEMQQNDTYI